MPVMLAKGSRSNTARGAPDIADKGFCASKSSCYYGIKLHAIALRRTQQLPLPACLHLSCASQHDLTALRELNPDSGEDCSVRLSKMTAEGRALRPVATRSNSLRSCTSDSKTPALIQRCAYW